ncbi:ATP-binding protein [Domibacillus mangrovi]|uniref:histidine kinase n=1 Tax=Domibacillus mangrovi TaxID=1714354 RepID=A0A1Q5NZY3_9BACI|nr:ATP-binding protein [Domibacillus mangrovi]OKL35506.1 histidine kinase [Domibacillus mangrovi]
MEVLSKSGIRRRYLRAVLSMLFVFVLIGTGAYLYMENKQDEMIEKREQLYDKQLILEELRDSLHDLFYSARGYYAFKDEGERTRIYEDLEQVKETLNELGKLKLTSQESQLADELAAFLIPYENETLPVAIAFVKANDYEGLSKLSKSGVGDMVDQFMADTKAYKVNIDDELEQLSSQMLEQSSQYTMAMMGLIVMLIVIISTLIWRTINDIVKPLEHMRRVADHYADGKSFSLLPLNRNDEIGVLASSFATMIHTIQDKEEELTAQNEELMMQQDELQERQLKMEESLKETEQTKERLERYNELNHVLSFSLDKQELTDSVLRYFDKVYEIDLGLFWLRESGEYALKGLTTAMFNDFMENRIDYVDRRLEETPYFIVKREALHEKGLADGNVYVHDYISGIRNPDGGVIALFGCSRIGRTFSNKEQEDLYGLLNRVYLAIERIQLYEQAVRERTLNESIVNNIHEGIQFISYEGDMVQHNKALYELMDFGVMTEEALVLREEWLDTFTKKTENPEELRAFFEACLANQSNELRHFSYVIHGSQERVIDVYSTSTMLDGEKTGTIFVHRDITQEHEVDKMKTELVSTVSHELRTPLSSVLGFTELLMTKELKPLKQKRYLETIYKEAQRLTNLINDFLDLQRMEAGSQVYSMSAIKMNEVIVETAAQFRSKTVHDFTIVDEAADVTVYADRERIIQVMTNIISNAVKFSPAGGQVTIMLKNEQADLAVVVRDQGIGIPTEEVSKLFTKFQRIDNSASRKIGGTGLGLAICREIVEKHSGKISIDSDEGKGTTVKFTIPLAHPNKNEAVAQETLEGRDTVMLVEDDTSLAMLLSEELKMKGFAVIYHSSPQSAFEEARQRPLIGIVIDIMLGEELDGWDLVRMLKEEVQTKNIPIIISSALDRADEKMCLYGIEHYLTKPYPPLQLSETVLSFLHTPVQDGRILYPDEAQGGADH